ncbi:prolyl oligopeptidase family serine peptidase [Flavobacterium tructae]|uniref:S9 family peptidase n=1 Tax=Flavobacterium tructae TaxID=1114873 RepID=UPI002551E1E5|nr:prolyl oligopeptidase family serine peptidase [Flavobacterium tructae]MDL2141659.1 prolyl oligopeptidase family serine peptidase [Flavobacterium tructae]
MGDIKLISDYLKKFTRFLWGLLCFVVTATCWGQEVPKRNLTEANYPLWSKLLVDKLSDKGQWSSYLLMYESKKDTLFVKSTKGNATYAFPYAKQGFFNGESHFACIARDTLYLVDLYKGSKTNIAGVQDFSFSGNGTYLSLLVKDSNGELTLILQDLKSNKKLEIPRVSQWHHEPDRNGLLYCSKSSSGNEIGYLSFGTTLKRQSILQNSKQEFQNLSWRGQTIAFVQYNEQAPQLFSYHITSGKLSVFDSQKQARFPKDMKVSDKKYQTLTISEDGEHIFFWMSEDLKEQPLIEPDAVEIWNTKDRLVFDHKKYIGQYIHMDKLAVWSVKTDTFLPITNKEQPKGFLSGDYRHAFVYDPIAYDPQSSFDGPYDLYLVDLQTGKRKKILEQYSGDHLTIPSPDGRYLAYAKEDHWWIYDINTDMHANISVSLVPQFFKNQDKPGQKTPYGVAGWTVQGNSIVLYDQYDLWELSFDGKIKRRLTKGRENNITYRIKNVIPEPIYPEDQIVSQSLSLSLDKGFFLQATDQLSGATGFFKWDSKNSEQKLIWESKKTNQLVKASKSNSYLYVEQSYECAPRLMFYKKSSKEIFQSNPQQKHFYWGKAERIVFKVNEKTMQGILYYPANYKKGVQYPMIVNIYERQFQHFNDYIDPTSHSSDGFNVTRFTQQGYFVLLPDMDFEIGNLAGSITKSVLAAVDTVIAKGSVNPLKVGLIGHSFGGYETDLIITQTGRFAAAVSGAAWTDLVSSYLYVGTTFNRPDFYRAEYDQLRIGKSLFEDTTPYLKNSPVLQASNVTTPLLGWTGSEDTHVHYLQSKEFYMALRRLGKEHILLVYPREGHNLTRKENQKDLSSRIDQWFGHYLKNEPPRDWMKSDFQ